MEETLVDKCYLCHDEATDERQFIDPNPCACKGTLRLHKSCAKELMNNYKSCSICKSKVKK
jgi:E3 ubiquitin-protein ligase DOA10